MENQEHASVRWQPGLGTIIAFYLIPLLFGLVYWLAIFPGVMSYDSVSQWDQLSRLQINDWHPAITTILMWLLTRLWYSPAVVSLFQVIFASLVTGYGLSSIYTVTRLPAWIFIAVAILVSANPLVGIVNVTLWKDVIYGYLVLLLTIFIFNIIKSAGGWIAKPIHFVVLGCTLASICLFRFNGFPVVIASLFCLFIFYMEHFKPLLFSSMITVVIMLFVLGPLYSIFKIDRSLRQTYGIPFVNPVAGYVSAHQALSSLSNAEKHYLDLIYPLDRPWTYSCYDATVFFYQDTNLYPVIQQPATMVRIFFRLASQDPLTAIKHFLCLSSFVWQPNQPKAVYLETVLLDNYNLDQTPAWTVYKNVVSQDPILPQLHNWISRLVKAEWHRDTSMLFWRPAMYMYVFLVTLVLLVIRSKVRKWLLLAVPLIAQSIIVMLTAQLQALRYQYPVYLISMLFTLPLLIVAIKNPRSLSVQSQ